MAGIMTAITTVKAILSAIDAADGDPKQGMQDLIQSAVNATKNGSLISINGSITKLLSQFVVEPTIIVSKDLKDSEVIYNTIQLQTDIFASYYLQAFQILTSIYKFDVNASIGLLADSKQTVSGLLKGKLTEVALDELGKSLESYSGRSYIGELLRDTSVSMSTEAITPAPRQPIKGVGTTMTKEKEKDASETLLYTTYQRTIELRLTGNAKVENAGKTTISKLPDGNTITNNETSYGSKEFTIVVPINIKANVIFTSYDNIENILSPRHSDKSFYYRLNEWKAGNISFWQLATASDLVAEYKKTKLRDKENILKIINSKIESSLVKGANTQSPTVGFERLYNMFIITEDDRSRLSRYMGNSLDNEKTKEKFLEEVSSMTLTTVDTTYEKIIIQTKDLTGMSITPFKAILRRKGNDNDLSEIYKSMLANKPLPVF